MARLVPCLIALRADFDEAFPDRDDASDGWIADQLHDEKSDHQPDARGLVHAIDVDADLSPMGDMQDVVDLIVQRCANGLERRLTYVIYDRVIWSASRGWKGRTYTGKNPHDKHAHFSASDEPAHENDNRTWHLEEIAMPTAAQIVDELLNRKLANGKTVAASLVDIERRTGSAENVRLPRIEEKVDQLKQA
jgi:hypothetical protein